MRPLLLIFLCAASIVSAQTRAVVALVRSDAPFLAGGSEAPGEGNVFEGESLASYYLPAWIDYQDGARYVLGIGSSARLGAEGIELQGVSLEIVSPGPGRRPISAAELEFRPSEDCQATLYLDRADTATVHVSKGSVEVYALAGERVGTVAAGRATTFVRIQGELHLQENRGPLEMARILLRELNFTFRLEDVVPPYGSKRRELSERLVEATRGVLMVDADIRGLGLSAEADETAAIDPGQVMRAAEAVSYEIHHSVGWDRYGCGKPACLSTAGVNAGYPFGGDARLLPPQPSGCLLCRREESVDP